MAHFKVENKSQSRIDKNIMPFVRFTSKTVFLSRFRINDNNYLLQSKLFDEIVPGFIMLGGWLANPFVGDEVGVIRAFMGNAGFF